MILQNGESPNSDGEDLSELFEPIFDPHFAVKRSFAQQKRLANAPGNAVVPASD